MERWLTDGMAVIDIPGAAEMMEVDMTRATALLSEIRRGTDVPITYTMLIVRAVAMALKRFPQIHMIVAGNKRYFPKTVDIGLSVLNEEFSVPAMVLKECENRHVLDIAAEVRRRLPEFRKDDIALGKKLQRFGWIVPLGFMRRALFRFLRRFLAFRLKAAGTFHITHPQYVDSIIPLCLTASAAVGIGKIRERVIAVDGAPAVRMTAILSCVFNHSVWDGMCAAMLLNEVRRILEEPDPELAGPRPAASL